MRKKMMVKEYILFVPYDFLLIFSFNFIFFSICHLVHFWLKKLYSCIADVGVLDLNYHL